MSKSKRDVAKDLYSNMQDLLEDISTIFDEDDEQADMTIIKVVLTTQTYFTIADAISTNILPYKEKIQARDLDFFRNNKSIFAGLPEDKIHYYGEEIVNKKRLSEGDMGTLWDYMDVLINISTEYVNTM